MVESWSSPAARPSCEGCSRGFCVAWVFRRAIWLGSHWLHFVPEALPGTTQKLAILNLFVGEADGEHRELLRSTSKKLELFMFSAKLNRACETVFLGLPLHFLSF